LPASAQVRTGDLVPVWLDLDASVIFDAGSRERIA